MKRLVVLALGCLFLGLSSADGQAPKKEDVPKFVKNLTAKDTKDRIEACQGIAKIGAIKAAYAKDAIEPLCTVLTKDDDAKVRAEAAKALGQIDADPEKAVPALSKAVEDKDRAVQIASLNALTQMGPGAKDALPAIKEAAARAKKDLADAGDDKAKANAAKQLAKAANAALKAVGK